MYGYLPGVVCKNSYSYRPLLNCTADIHVSDSHVYFINTVITWRYTHYRQCSQYSDQQWTVDTCIPVWTFLGCSNPATTLFVAFGVHTLAGLTALHT